LEFFNRTNGTKEELQYAKTVIMICILSIILTAPLGAVLIAITGPRFLNKSIESKVDLNELDDMLESKP
jgi:solute carrier family 9B (sodium/hydrogen exchanger), member 1/2